MKKYWKEIIIILIQIGLFYLLPLIIKDDGIIFMILALLLGTFALTLIINVISDKKIKYFYPIIATFIFIPSIFLYYNSSAWIHTIWYFIDSLFGEIIGICIYKIKANNKDQKKKTIKQANGTTNK